MPPAPEIASWGLLRGRRESAGRGQSVLIDRPLFSSAGVAEPTAVGDLHRVPGQSHVRTGRSIDILTGPETPHRASALHVLRVLRTLVADTPMAPTP